MTERFVGRLAEFTARAMACDVWGLKGERERVDRICEPTRAGTNRLAPVIALESATDFLWFWLLYSRLLRELVI